MTNSKYCFDFDPQIERLLDDTLSQIAKDAVGDPSSKNLQFLVLGGGYGRGEGGITVRGDGSRYLYNDLDFFVICRDGTPRRARAELDALFVLLARKWSLRLGIDVDFCPARSVSYIRARLDMQMWREMAEGATLVIGKRADFEKYFPRSSAQPPPSEAAKLMFNRLYGLFLARRRLCKKNLVRSDCDFIARNINKAVLACGETVLMSKNSYVFKTPDRLEKLQSADMKDFPAAEELRRAYAEAAEFKRSPLVPENHEILLNRWNEAAGLSLAVLDYVRGYLASGGSPSISATIKNLRKNFSLGRLFASLGVKAPRFKSPIIPAIDILKSFIEKDCDINSDAAEAFDSLWRRIN